MATAPVAPEVMVVLAAKAVEVDIDCGWSLEECRSTGIAVLDAIPDGWAKIDGEWVQVAQADRYDVEGPSGVIDGANVLVTMPVFEEG